MRAVKGVVILALACYSIMAILSLAYNPEALKDEEKLIEVLKNPVEALKQKDDLEYRYAVVKAVEKALMEGRTEGSLDLPEIEGKVTEEDIERTLENIDRLAKELEKEVGVKYIFKPYEEYPFLRLDYSFKVLADYDNVTVAKYKNTYRVFFVYRAPDYIVWYDAEMRIFDAEKFDKIFRGVKETVRMKNKTYYRFLDSLKIFFIFTPLDKYRGMKHLSPYEMEKYICGILISRILSDYCEYIEPDTNLPSTSINECYERAKQLVFGDYCTYL